MCEVVYPIYLDKDGFIDLLYLWANMTGLETRSFKLL